MPSERIDDVTLQLQGQHGKARGDYRQHDEYDLPPLCGQPDIFVES
jgi:hypothetical protein